MALCTEDRVLRMSKSLIKSMEPHLAFLTANVRQALVAQAVLGVVTGQDESISIDPADVHKLHIDILDTICFETGNEFYFR